VGIIRWTLALRRFVKDLGKCFDLTPLVNLCLIEFVFEPLQLRRVGCLLEARLVVVRLERPEDVHGFINEIEHKGCILAGQKTSIMSA